MPFRTPGPAVCYPGDDGREARDLSRLESDRRDRMKPSNMRSFRSAFPALSMIVASRFCVLASRLWEQQGRKKQAHGMPAEICGWFTEGFDTADLASIRNSRGRRRRRAPALRAANAGRRPGAAERRGGAPSEHGAGCADDRTRATFGSRGLKEIFGLGLKDAKTLLEEFW
jgi:hypothetical protein